MLHRPVWSCYQSYDFYLTWVQISTGWVNQSPLCGTQCQCTELHYQWGTQMFADVLVMQGLGEFLVGL